jgi:hypothetical protein
MDSLKKTAAWLDRTFCECRAPGSRVLLYAVWIAYCIAGFAIASRHEAWFDEAQAWLIARDLGIGGVFSVLPYEGTPPLWHLILMLPAKAGLPFVFIHVLSVMIMCCGVYLVLFKSPFPLGVRIAIPFNYFLIYQYLIVSRSYCLMLPLLSLVAMFYRDRHRKPWRYVLAVVLLSWVSSHAAVIAGGLVAAEVLTCLFTWKSGDATTKKSVAAIAGVFAVNSIALAFMCWPAKDISFIHPIHVSLHRYLHINEIMIEQGICSYILVSLLILFVIFKYALSRHKLLEAAAMFVLLTTLYGFVFSNLWHAGIIVCWILLTLWIASADAPKWPRSLAAVVLLMTLLQLPGAISTIRRDWEYPYSGAGAAASAIREISPRVHSIEAYGFASHAVLAYFDNGEITFSNAPKPWHEYYTWSARSIPAGTPHTIHGSADLILVAKHNKGARMTPPDDIRPDGYKTVGVYPGNTFWKTDVFENYCYYLFRRAKTS